MVLTAYDKIEIAALAAVFVYAWFSPIRFAACSTLLALLTFHGLARVYIGHYGPDGETLIRVAIVASVIALAHLFFDYSSYGLVTGIAFAAIPIFAGLALSGVLPVTYQQGPGLDFWTLTTASTWIALELVRRAVGRAKRNALG